MDTLLYDITDVCKMLGVTSRTLRFYEEKGIISSTTVGLSARRQYTAEQISHIRNVLVLRTLGLSLRAIADLQREKSDLKDAVLAKRAEIYASINTRLREINLLNEALTALESGKNIFDEKWQGPPAVSAEETEVARRCTEALLNGEDEVLFRHISPRLAQYMPPEVYRTVREDTLAPLGESIAPDGIVTDESQPNRIYSRVQFSRLGLQITFVFHGGMIDGLWLGYYDPKERRC